MKKLSLITARVASGVASAGALLASLRASAQGLDTSGVESVGTSSGLPAETITQTILVVITWGLGIAGTVAVLFLIVGGFLYITAGGDERRLESAKTTLKNAIIGTVFILISLVIVITLNTILGV